MTTSPTNILILVVDSLRYDHLCCYGYEKPTSPFLDSLAADGIKFEQAYSTAPWTVPVHGSLFSGQLPSYHGTHRKSKSFKKSADESLAGLLSEVGYQTAGFSANPWLSSELQFDAGFDHFESLSGAPPFPDESTAPNTAIEHLYSVEGMRSALRWCSDGNPLKRFSNGIWKRYFDTGAGVTRVNKTILEWIDNNNYDKKFIFANYMDVHDPHYDDLLNYSDLRLPSASTRLDLKEHRYRAGYSKRIDFMSKPSDTKRSKQLYDRAIRRLDQGLKNMFDKLEDILNLNESLVIILGDHGESLGDNTYWGHGSYLHESLIRIPLLISPSEGNQPLLDRNRPVSIIDITDYITQIANASMDGRENSKASFISSQNRPIFAETTGPRHNMEEKSLRNGFEAVIHSGQKLVRNRTTGETELRNLDNSEGDCEPDQKQLETLLDEKWHDTDYEMGNEEPISEEMRSRLSDLGYI